MPHVENQAAMVHSSALQSITHNEDLAIHISLEYIHASSEVGDIPQKYYEMMRSEKWKTGVM